MTEKVRSLFHLADSEDVIRDYGVTYKTTNAKVKGKMYITQNYFCFKPSSGKDIQPLKILIASIKNITDEIVIIDAMNRSYTFIPQTVPETYNIMNYMVSYPYSILDTGIYKQHVITQDESGRSSKFDLETAQQAYNTAVELKQIKQTNYDMLVQQSQKIDAINDMLDEIDGNLKAIDEGIKASKSIVYELTMRYVKKTEKPQPKEELPVIEEQLKKQPPRKVDVEILWKFENDELVPALMTIFDDKVEVVEKCSDQKKKPQTKSFLITEIKKIVVRSRPLHMNVSINQSGKERGRLRLCATCLQFICNELYMRYVNLKSDKFDVVFELNSRQFDYGDMTITRTFMNCGGIRSQIKFEEKDSIVMEHMTEKEREDYIKMIKMNGQTANIFEDVRVLNNKTAKLGDESIMKMDGVTDKMHEQNGTMKMYQNQLKNIN